jgi:L-malate glycosyltransferase
LSRLASTGAPGRLRLAFVYDALYPYVAGGAERRYHEIATRLAERHDVSFFSWGYWGSEPTFVRSDGITFHRVGPARPLYGTDGKRTIREAAEFATRLLPILSRERFDVVDASATPYLPLYAAWLATRVSRTPLVATWHEFWGEHWSEYLPDRRFVARLAGLGERGARPLADARVAVSALTARRLLGQAGVAAVDATVPSAPSGAVTDRVATARSVTVVGNGVDLGRFSEAGPDSRRSDVIHVGRLIDEKRVDVLLEATAILARTRPAIRVTVVGDGPELERLQRLARALGIATNVAFLGRVDADRVPGLLKAARTLALPSIREGYGIAVVEAQAAGAVPVVARSPLSAAADLVTDGLDGVLCPPTADGLATALAMLLDDEARRSRLASAAIRTAAHRGWDERALEMEQLYLSAAGARARDRGPARAAAGAR